VPLPRIDAHSASGEVELALPERASFQLEAVAQRGEAVNDFGPEIETQTEGRTATMKGAIGDGPAIRITTERGTISLRKEGSAPTIQVPPPPVHAAPAAPALPPTPAPPKAPAPVNLKELKL
jgi:hypothetical protein